MAGSTVALPRGQDYSLGYATSVGEAAQREAKSSLGLSQTSSLGGVELVGVAELTKKWEELYNKWDDSMFATSKIFAKAVLNLSQDYVPYNYGVLYSSAEIRTDTEGGLRKRTVSSAAGPKGRILGYAHMIVYDDAKALAVHENAFVPAHQFNPEGSSRLPPGAARGKRGEKFLTRALDELSSEFPSQVEQGLKKAMIEVCSIPSSPTGRPTTGTAATAATVGKPRLMKKAK